MAVNRNLGITTLYDVTSLKNKRFAVKLQEDSLFIKCHAKISTFVSFTEADLVSWANNPHFTIAQYLFGKIKVKGGVEYIGNIVDEDVQKHFFDPVGPTSYHQQTEWMGVFPTLKKPGHYLLMCDFKNVPFGATIPGGTTFISARLTVYQDVPPDAFKVEIEEPAPKQIYDSGEAIIFRTYPTVEEFHPAGILYQVQRLEPDPTLKDSPLPVWQQGGYHQVWSTWTYPKYSVELPGNISLTLGWHRVRAHSQGSIDINTTFDQTSPWRYFFINTLVKIPPGVVQ